MVILGPGSFYKEHIIDNPKSDFSLVVILPTQHEGGSIRFRHFRETKRVFDTAKSVRLPVGPQDVAQAAFFAFYKSIRHEVLLVSSGYRVTLTYDIHFAKSVSPLRWVESAANDGESSTEHLKVHLAKLLQDPTFLPQGGLLGFGLSHGYPFLATSTSLAELVEYLKVSDADTLRMCESIGLNVTLKTQYRSHPDSPYPTACILDEFADQSIFEYEIENNMVKFISERYQGIMVYDALRYPETLEGTPIMWIKPLTDLNAFKSRYLHYGNEPSISYLYGDVCLVATIAPSNVRCAN